MFKPDGSPLGGFEAAMSDGSPFRKFVSTKSPFQSALESVCVASARVAGDFFLPTVAHAQATQDCDNKKRDLVIWGALSTVSIVGIVGWTPEMVAACGLNNYLISACTVAYGGVAASFLTALDSYTECLDGLASTQAMRAYYQTPNGLRDIENILGTGPVTTYEFTLQNQFATPVYILNQLRDAYRAGQAASVPTGFVTAFPLLPNQMPVISVPAGGGTTSPRSFIDWLLSTYLHVPQQ